MVVPVVDDVLLRAETGYAGAAVVLCAVLWALERRGAVGGPPPVPATA